MKTNPLFKIEKHDGKGWGFLPQLCISCAFGLILVSIADAGARRGMIWAETLFWSGLILMFAPIVARLLSKDLSRKERLGLLVILGIGLYCIKVLQYPQYFAYADELKHWRSTEEILKTQHLFEQNSILPVSPFYPGLQNITTALIGLSGLDIFPAGLLIIGAAKLLLLIALFLFSEEVSKSGQIASIATLLYMTNPNFVFFDSQFSYESLALPFIALVLFTINHGLRKGTQNKLGFLVFGIIFQLALVVTHHISSYFLVAFLVIWTLVYHIKGSQDQDEISPSSTMLIAIVTTLIWIIYIADITINYLGSGVVGSLSELLRLITHESAIRGLFTYTTGTVVPLWLKITGYLAVILLLIGLVVSLFYIWNRYRKRTIIITLAIVGLMYPLTHLLRFTQNGSEYAGRFAPFIFLALSILLSLSFIEPYLFGNLNPKRWLLVFSSILVIFIGSVSVGISYWGLMPGPYLVIADWRSVESQGIDAAQWARFYLGPNNRIGADRINGLLMGSYGLQYQVSSTYDGINVPQVFLSPTMGSEEINILQQGQIQYLVTDMRLPTSLPILGFYYEQGEQDIPMIIEPNMLTKFDKLSQVSRIFDDGQIVIYDVKKLSHVP